LTFRSRASVLDVSHETCRTHLQYVYDGIVETRKNLRGRVPLIGFAGAPWTLMCYMIDGSGSEKSKGKFAQAINWLYMHPEAAHKLLDKLAREIAAHLVEQVRHGAHLVQLFDTWAGLLPPHLYAEFGLPYVKLTLDLFRAEIKDAPAICFAKGAFFALEQLSKLGFNALSLDWTIDPVWGREQVGGRCGLQGNLDPLCLHASKEKIRSEVKAMLTKFNHSSTGLKHYVANLGHGCLPSFDPEHVGCFVDAVHEFSKEIISSSK
jgi:uroporphyrinogen decarboxylase